MQPPEAKRNYEDIVVEMLQFLQQSRQLTDTQPGSVVRTLVEAFAREMLEGYERLGHLYAMGFIDTAEGNALDQLVALLGVTRIDGSVARGIAVFHRDTRVSGNIVVPRGTAVRVLNQAAGKSVSYLTLAQLELRTGRNEGSVDIWAELPADIDPNSILLDADDVQNGTAALVDRVAGIASVSIDEPSTARGRRETDDELRERVKGLVAAAGGGTAKAIERAVLAVPGVNAVRLRDAGDTWATPEAPAGDPALPTLLPGELELILDADLNDARLLQNVQQAVDAVKGPGICVKVRGIQPLALAFDLYLEPATGDLTAEQRETLIGAVERTVAAHFGQVDVGQPFVWNQLLAELLRIDGVVDVDLERTAIHIDGTVQTPKTPANVSAGKVQRIVLAAGQEAVVVHVSGAYPVYVGLAVHIPTAAPPDRADREARAVRSLLAALATINDRPSGRVLKLDDVVSAVGPELDGLLDRSHIVVHLFSTRDQSLVELRAGAREEISFEATDFLRAAPEKPAFAWTGA